MIITLCGSTRFKREYEFWNLLLTLSGHIVLSCCFFHHAENNDLKRFHKAKLDIMHLNKIDISDAIFVIDKDKYIGESTEREIVMAEYFKKMIFYVSENESFKKYMIFQNKNIEKDGILLRSEILYIDMKLYKEAEEYFKEVIKKNENK